MTIEGLEYLINNRKKELKTSSEKDGYNYLVDFLENNKLDNVGDFLDIDIWKFIICNLYIQSNKSIDEVIKFVDLIKPLFTDMKVLTVASNLDRLITLVEKDGVDDAINYLKCNSDIYEQRYLNNINDINDSLRDILVALKKKMNDEKINILSFFEGLKDYNITLVYQMYLYCIRYLIDTTDTDFIIGLTSDEMENKKRKIRKVELFSKAMKNGINVKASLTYYQYLKKYVEEYSRGEKRKQKEIEGIDLAYNMLVKNIDKKEFVFYHDIAKLIKDDGLRYSFLLYIKEHNSSYYQELEDELTNLETDSQVSIKALLKKYGIRKEYYDIDLMMNYSKEDLEEILSLVSLLDITVEEKVLVIYNTSLEEVRLLKEYVRKNILDLSFISHHLELLTKDSKELNCLNKNLLTLKELNINIMLFNNMELFLNNADIIRDNLFLLNTYNLLNSLKTTNNYDFLTNPLLAMNIDKLLEYGFEDYLLSDLSLLNTKVIKRLDVFKVMNIPITSKEQLLDILDNNKHFFVKSADIDKYLGKMDNSFETELSLDDLEKYMISERLYDFDGIKVSINKVKRMIDKGETLFKAIIDGLVLDEDELTKIKDVLDSGKKLFIIN